MLMTKALRSFGLICCLLTAVLSAQGQEGISFEKGSWANILQIARERGKPVFVDMYTTWCIPCRKMAAEVFVLPEISGLFNKEFVNVKIDAEKGEGIDIAKRYKVGAYPTYLFVNPDGTLVYRSVGYMPSERFASEARLALREASDPKPLASWQDEYESRKTDTAFVRSYLEKRRKLALDNADVADQYAALLDRSRLLDKTLLVKILQMEHINTDGYLLSFIRSNKQDVLSALDMNTRAKLDDHLANLVARDVERAIEVRDEKLLEQIFDFLMNSPSGELPAAWKAYDTKMKYYARVGDTTSLATVFKQYAKEALSFDPGPLVQADSLALAQFEKGLADGSIKVKPDQLTLTRRSRGSTKKTSYAYRLRDAARGALNGLHSKEMMSEGLKLIDKALQFSDNFSIHEVKAGLLYQSGDRAAGIQWMDKTIAIWEEMSRELNLGSEKVSNRLAETRARMLEGKASWSY